MNLTKVNTFQIYIPPLIKQLHVRKKENECMFVACSSESKEPIQEKLSREKTESKRKTLDTNYSVPAD